MQSDPSKRIPVILDTDIGTDIDDSWALVQLLHSPELDLRLVTTATGDTTYRAALATRMLEAAGRTDIPIGIGRPWGTFEATLKACVTGQELSRYAGTIRLDAAALLAETIMTSPEPVTIIAIAPLTNVAAALTLEPRIATRARLVGMHGSLRSHFDGAPGAIAEWNVVQDIAAARQVFSAPWPKVITPLDTCGRVRLDGQALRRLAASASPLARLACEHYQAWLAYYGITEATSGWHAGQPHQHSSILFDTVAVHLACSRTYLRVESLGIRVTDEGFTIEDPAAPRTEVATEWEDLAGFTALLTARILGDTPDPGLRGESSAYFC